MHRRRATPVVNRSTETGSASSPAANQDRKDAVHLGGQIRAERKRLRPTQTDLAEKVGTTRPNIARPDAGVVTRGLDIRHRAASALGLELIVDFHQQAPVGRRGACFAWAAFGPPLGCTWSSKL
jgi:hypothetical protein